MKTALHKLFPPFFAAGALALWVAGCAAQSASPEKTEGKDARAASAPDARTPLVCTLSSNCVNSLSGSDLAPLPFKGTPDQALAALRATLTAFPEAKIIQTDALSMQVVFTTTVGFKDLVDFEIDAQAQRINFRSRSSFGLYDFGKNRSRMEAFAQQFARSVAP